MFLFISYEYTNNESTITIGMDNLHFTRILLTIHLMFRWEFESDFFRLIRCSLSSLIFICDTTKQPFCITFLRSHYFNITSNWEVPISEISEYFSTIDHIYGRNVNGTLHHSFRTHTWPSWLELEIPTNWSFTCYFLELH